MNIVKITKENFDREVKDSKIPVLIDFWASWCGPCQMQGPVLDDIANEYDGVKIGKINVDEEQALAMEYGISSIPTLMILKDGKAVDTLVGLRSKEELVSSLGL